MSAEVVVMIGIRHFPSARFEIACQAPVIPYVPDSSGDDLAHARTYFFGHPDCVRKFYRGLVDHKLDLFKHMPTTAPLSPEDLK